MVKHQTIIQRYQHLFTFSFLWNLFIIQVEESALPLYMRYEHIFI